MGSQEAYLGAYLGLYRAIWAHMGYIGLYWGDLGADPGYAPNPSRRADHRSTELDQSST